MLSTLRGSIVALIFALIVVTAASTGCSGLFEDLDDLQFSGSQNQTPNQASAELSSITGESGLPADGESVATITIELFDSLGDPIAGVTPSFTASGEGNDLLDCGSTDETGVATCGLVSVQPGAKELSITHPVSVSGDPIVFLPTCDPESAEFGGGEGHADDPWRICSVEQLELISDTSAGTLSCSPTWTSRRSRTFSPSATRPIHSMEDLMGASRAWASPSPT